MFVSSLHLFIYSITYLYQYGVLDTYFLITLFILNIYVFTWLQQGHAGYFSGDI